MIGQLWLAETSPGRRSGPQVYPPAAYMFDKLCLLPHPLPKHHRRAVDGKGDNDSVTIPLIPRIVRRVAAGNQAEAAELSIRRLQACGLRPMVTAIPDTNADQMKRMHRPHWFFQSIAMMWEGLCREFWSKNATIQPAPAHQT